jgi:threonine aldolase
VRSFASDTHAPAHPAVLAAVAAANDGHAPAYGADPWTARAEALFRDVFGEDAETLFTLTGTAANVLALQAVVRPWEAVVCAETAHVHVDECGAPERFLGSKLLAVPAEDGKLTPALVDRCLHGLGDEHRAQPRAVSAAQSTELGTVYRPHELRALADHVHARGLVLHLDGARLANAAAALGLGLREATRDLGVDVLSFGGTKSGLLAAEAVVVLRPGLADGLRFARKQAMQLVPKMRFVAAQLEALLTGDLWLVNAAAANAAARSLEASVRALGIEPVRPVEANAVFVRLPQRVIERLRAQHPFEVWDAAAGEVRWMTSWDTTDADVEAFAAAVERALAA